MKTSLWRRIILIALISTGFGLTSVFSGRSVFAQETRRSVRRVSVPVATGQSAASPVLIELSPGYGVNISFIPTGETVEKVWFDNPSFATLDVDGCLSGLGRECQQNAATVLHLRRINSLNMPGLPKTNSTLLTVVTAGVAGRRVYMFRVAMGNKNSQYHTVEVTPKETPEVIANNPPRMTSVLTQYQDSQMISRGLIVAQQQRLIRRDSPLWKRIENFLVSVKAGEPIEVAAAKSGISLQLVKRLQELGKTSPVPPPLQAS
ncbi:hypothetical protein NIES4075_68660 [Tolypothrix sp. NIES-4075]|uniref:hypothetical protein n=1 Tax=Tolypothrix sp. NIES-4075 TaxID=2005459 RepID=UPI000B5CB178|nr:hypothetical protein [Tolypothrix sp. NIES-4075]GAX45845.1 hypothetical protein NIES4075_68660 [Tolypothrix sp. NIES-4075]